MGMENEKLGKEKSTEEKDLSKKDSSFQKPPARPEMPEKEDSSVGAE